MSSYIGMTLEQFSKKFDIPIQKSSYGGFYVVPDKNTDMWELFHLSDYAVCTVSGPVYWLWKRRVKQ